MTQNATRFYTHGTGAAQRSTARNLIALSGPAQHILDQTVEIYSKYNVIVKAGRFGETVYVRFNNAYPTRYFPVLHSENGDYTCTCGESACKHVRQAIRHIKSQEVA